MGIRFDRVDSRSELLEQLRKGKKSVLMGDDDEASREYFIGELPGCMIGICSQGHGIRPFCLVDETSEDAWIGYNSKVASVRIRECRLSFVLKLDCVFVSILDPLCDGSVIVVYELGACRISRSGELVWKCATDIVTDFADDGEFLRLQTDKGEIRIDKEQGMSL